MTRLAESAVRHWDFRRGVEGTSVLVRFGTDHGVPRRTLLAGSGLTAAQLADPSLEVEARQELRVVRNLAAALPDAGVAAGREYHATTFGILGFAFLSSPTMGAAVAVALRYYDLSFAFSIPDVTVADGQVRLVLDDRLLPADVARFLVERDLAAIHTVIDELLPAGVPLTGLEFRFAEPEVSDQYEATFGLRPRFGCPANVATFDASYLTEPLPLANAHTVAMCEAQCRDIVARRRARSGTAHEVRELLTRLGALGSPMPEVARELNLSTRTLRRRLEEEGTSFRALLDEVREALAEELLTKGAVPVEDVAVRLGYAEASSFIHAFKRWKGVTPIAYVRQRPGAR
ncbi:AraC family transcriptional regulator [Actinophytocola algeriensis]|uniref:AraC-like DNA-binding protein n=1 Tax=Actinophytocola algeriensis TaxID=1768010 RepID=A0A7W7VHW5_9PSEU|nr:AraC family transcriptional regulator [Actinophytocola algeriensis]MBB4910932.1 AraC-like DNA-binding protein [Actinophytocola algeriensis]MBE1473925.1 AraC-like DNA-binding protein [Actinophytocola algeriensis]